MSRIKTRREKLNLSQGDLGELIGKTQNQIYQYESGKVHPSAPVLKELALTLGVSADWLLEMTDIEDRPLRGQGDLSDDEREMLKAFREKDALTRERIREMILKIF